MLKRNRVLIGASVLFCLCLLLGCKHEKRQFAYFEKERGFFFDVESFDDFLFHVERNSVFPICGNDGVVAQTCPFFPGTRAFLKSAEIKTLGQLSRDRAWRLKYVEAKGDTVSIYLLEPLAGAATPDVYPSFWIESKPGATEALIHLTPVVPLVQFYHHTFNANHFRYLDWKRFGDYETVIQVSGDPILGIRSQWKDPLRLEFKFKHVFPKQKTIVLDPGHGAEDLGTTASGFVEKDKALEASGYLKSQLEAAGFRVFLTRDKDGVLSLEDRVRLAESHDADLFISVHLDNWMGGYILPDPPEGLVCYFFNWFSRPFAKELCGGMLVRGYPSSWITKRSLYVLHSTQFPSLLLELGNLARPDDVRLIRDDRAFKRYLRGVAGEIRKLLP